MPKRNWKAIEELNDPRTRNAIFYATDPEILACYAKGFPHLFNEGEDDGPRQPIPLSAMREAARAFDEMDGNDFTEKDAHFHFSKLDAAVHVRPTYRFTDDGDEEVLKSISYQLVGQKAQAGMKVSYLGREYVITTIFFVGEEPEVGTTFTEPPDIDFVDLIDPASIDLDK